MGKAKNQNWYRILALCRILLLIPTIIWWSSPVIDNSMINTKFDTNNLRSFFGVVIVLLITALVIFALTFSLYFKNLKTVTIVWIAFVATTTTTITFASAVSLVLQPTTEANLHLQANYLYSSASPQKKQSQAPPVELTGDLQFVPLTREYVLLAFVFFCVKLNNFFKKNLMPNV